MKKLMLLTALNLLGLFAFAGNPPANYPAVNGVVKKIDLPNKQIILKHERIPNLNMPGMTMPFIIEDVAILQGIQVSDKVHFSADQNENGDLVLVWIEKELASQINESTPILCTGVANTSPKINVEIEIRHNKYSTIRYEYAEGSYKGTTYINSIGDMTLTKNGHHFLYQAGREKLDSKLSFEQIGNQIQNAKFYNFSAGMNFEQVQCAFQN